MKKILCALTAAIMLAAQCAAYAETDTYIDSGAVGAELMTVLPETIDGQLTEEETEQITAAIQKAVSENIHPDDMQNAENYIEVKADAITADYPSDRYEAIIGFVQNYIRNNPEYFYLERGVRSLITSSSSNPQQVLSSILLEYNCSEEERTAVSGELDNEINDIKARMHADGINLDAIKNGTDEEKEQAEFDAALWLHDYLADTITYDYRAYSQDPQERDKVRSTVDAALLGERLTVCEGYANAYKYILEEIGMECINVYSDDEEHEWSAVKIGGAWYYVDVTQDDNDKTKNIKHSYFLVTYNELLGGDGTHEGGYITESDIEDMQFGNAFEGALWHGNFQTAEDGQVEWHDSIIESKVIFDGDSRYYCGYDDSDNTDIYTAVYKCGAQLDDPTVLCRIEDGLWFVSAESRSFLPGYRGGMGKQSIADGDTQKTYLYFNSPKVIYKLETAENAQPEKVFEYTPTDSENYNCMFGITVDGIIRYAYADLINVEDGIGYENINIREVNPNIYTVNFYDAEDAENIKLIASDEVKQGQTLNAPEYMKYGYVITGWSRNTDGSDMWDFENDTVTESVDLYVIAEEARMGESPLQIHARSGKLLGTLNASIVDFNDKYSEAPAYILAVYDNNTLVAVKTSDTGEFNVAPEDNIPYTETTAVKVYAWSSEYEPYLDGAAVEIIKASTGGEGEEEDEGGTGGETGGDEGEGETGGETGSGETGE